METEEKQAPAKTMDRSKTIIRTGALGILVNIILVAFKSVVGWISGSIAIILDAVNNLSDVLSSVITIVGTRFAMKKPDKDHPFGHGRSEYVAASVIAVIILYAGVTALIESVKKIIHPTTPDYSTPTLIIVAAAVLAKILLGRHVVKVGKRVDSETLIGSGKDALNDSIVSFATLVAAIIFLTTDVCIEAYLAAVISLLMIKTGIDLLRKTISQILGERPNSEKAKEIKRIVNEYPEVYGVYDLVLHNYGPESLIGSLHVEVPEDMTVAQLDRLQREIADQVYDECGVILTGISVYGRNMQDNAAADLQKDIRRIVMGHDHVLQMHGFYVNSETKDIQFDAVIGYEAPDRMAVYREVVQDLTDHYPEYHFKITVDADVSD